MRCLFFGMLLVLLSNEIQAQSNNLPLDDERLTIHTLVREDVFAGWQENDLDRLARAEGNIETLLEKRPDSRAELLAWKGAAGLYRAVLAHEADDQSKFDEGFRETQALFAEARRLDRENIGVCAVCGGSLLMFADRLPKQLQADAWEEVWEDYQLIWKQQGPAVDRMPLHIRGELLAGVAQSAQRTGRTEELDQYLRKIIEVLPDSGYAREARKWMDDPQAASTGSLGCKSCHSPGRLSTRIREIGGR